MQGFYFTFYSLIFLRLFADLGLGYAVVQIISHSFADIRYKSKLDAYKKLFVNWFVIVSIIMFFVLVPAILFFKSRFILIDNYPIRIIAPWILLAAGISVDVFISGLLYILEGYQKILEANSIRLYQSITKLTLIVGVLLTGGELSALAFGYIGSVVIGAKYLFKHKHLFKIDRHIDYTPINWSKEIWPFQWRLAMSWISGFFIFYSLTPLVMKFSGPISAGQMGMSLQLFQAINSISMLYVSTYSATFGYLIATNQIRVMEKLFKSNLLKSSILLLFFLSLFWLLNISFVPHIKLFDNRLLDGTSLWLLTGACVCNHIFFSMNYYFRSFKEEPLWAISVTNSIVIIALSSILCAKNGTYGAVLVYTGSNLFFWVLIGLPFFFHRRKKLYVQFD